MKITPLSTLFGGEGRGEGEHFNDEKERFADFYKSPLLGAVLPPPLQHCVQEGVISFFVRHSPA